VYRSTTLWIEEFAWIRSRTSSHFFNRNSFGSQSQSEKNGNQGSLCPQKREGQWSCSLLSRGNYILIRVIKDLLITRLEVGPPKTVLNYVTFK